MLTTRLTASSVAPALGAGSGAGGTRVAVWAGGATKLGLGVFDAGGVFDADLFVDEDFRDELGRYVHPEHCGACDAACPVPPTAIATCASGGCGFACLPGFVDCDGEPSNGCELEISDPARSVIFCEGFESGLGAWTAEPAGTVLWTTSTVAHTGARSARSTWGTSGCDVVRSLYLARDLDLSGVSSATLELWHRAVVGSSDYLRVLVSTDGGATWSTLASASYVRQTYDLTPHAGTTSLRIGFRFRNVCGNAHGVDWYVDDVTVHVVR